MKIKQAICAILALMILSVSGAGVMAYSTHTPIRIDSNNDFSTYASSGNGTELNPWIITDLDINGTGYGYCIYIGNTTDFFTIEDCYLHEAYISNSDALYQPNAGIVLNNVENAIITGNEIELNDGTGVFLYNSDNNLISYNYVNYNVESGIAIDESHGNEIYRNTADYNDIGIYINGASGNLIDDNLAFYNEYAIYFEGATYNDITYNSLCLSDSYGIYFDADAGNNELWFNNFGNNVNQAYDEAEDNDWNKGYLYGGNYWTDYEGVDYYTGPQQNQPGSDGVGDTSYYDIDGGTSWDRYPLMDGIETYGIGQRDDPSGIGQRDDPS